MLGDGMAFSIYAIAAAAKTQKQQPNSVATTQPAAAMLYMTFFISFVSFRFGYGTVGTGRPRCLHSGSHPSLASWIRSLCEGTCEGAITNQ